MTPDDVEAMVTPKAKRAEIAAAYARLLTENVAQLGTIDVSRLNMAIKARWSWSGLRWIKQRAWKLAEKGQP